MGFFDVVFDTLMIYRDGDGVFLDKRSAIELFRPLEELNNSCTRIRFGNHIFGVKAARVAKRALIGVQKTLTDVEFVYFVFGRSEGQAIKIMRIFSSALKGCMLRSLTLQLGELGEKGVKAFAPLLKSQKTLGKLEFISSTISVEAAEAIFKLLPSIERIESLHIIYNEKGDAETLSELFKKCIALEDLNFSENNFGTCDAVDLEESENNFGPCDAVDLEESENNFDTWDAVDLEESLEIGSSLAMHVFEFNSCAVSLTQVINGHLGLTKVDLRYTNLQDEGVIAIALSLKNTAPSLRVLTVGGNDITPKAAPALAECLAVKNLLTLFSARHNKLKDDGSVVICKAISEGHEQLKELDLSENAMTGIGAKAAAEAVANKPDFSGLYIWGNFITKKEIESVKDVLRKGTKGESVLGHFYQYKDVGAMQYEYREEGLTDSDSDTESEEKFHKP